MLRLRPLAWSGVRSDAEDGTSDVRCGAQDGTSDARCGAQVQIQPQVQLPAQLSNSTGSAKSLIEPAAQPTRELKRRTSPLGPFALLSLLTSAILQIRPAETGRDNRRAKARGSLTGTLERISAVGVLNRSRTSSVGPKGGMQSEQVALSSAMVGQPTAARTQRRTHRTTASRRRYCTCSVLLQTAD